jgi:carboxyl-terminal processing protease
MKTFGPIPRALFLLFFFLSSFLAEGQNGEEEQHEKRTDRKFGTLIHHLDNAYVDSVDTEELTEVAIRSMLEELDPHTTYIPPERVKEMRQPLEGNFEGIGIKFNILNDTILVVRPIPGGPSEKLGIRSGDKIVKIDGEKVAGIGITNSGVRDRLLGEKDSKVEVSIYREGEPELIHYEIVRDKIPINSVRASYMVQPGLGYIKIERFSGRTMEEFKKAMSDLKEKGMEKLILDLQGNSGGYLRTGLKVADQFLQEDRLIVYTEGRAFPRRERRATDDSLFQEGDLVVMMDESSASASEIVAGAVQDWDRGIVVGRRSFGKGMVQRPIDLPDGSVVRLTISRYHTPSGRCIQKPYEKGNPEAYAKEKYQRMESGELFHEDSMELADSLRYETRIKERPVYGGGGIVPDVFVPIDTSGNSDYLQALRRNRVISDLALDHADEEREKIRSEYEDAATFAEEYQVSEELKEKMVQKAEEKGVEYDEEGFERSKEYVLGQLKGMIAQNIWGTEAYFRVHNPLRPSYMKAIEVLSDGSFDEFDLAESR